MNIIDIIIIIFLVLGALAGFKKGAIKGLVHLIGLVAILIIAYEFKDKVAGLFIKYLPFFNLTGKYEGLYSLNFLLYEGAAFFIVFILLYCLLNILLNISGFLDLLVKATIILEIPSKIIGMIIGLIEALIYVFAVCYALMLFSPTAKYVESSKVATTILNRTPVVRTVFNNGIASANEIYDIIVNKDENTSLVDTNLEIIRVLVHSNIVSSDIVNECIENGKLHMENVVVAG